MRLLWTCCWLILLLWAPRAWAHETWMLAGDDAELSLRVSSGMHFPAYESAIDPARVEPGASLLLADGPRSLTTFVSAADYLRIETGQARPTSALAWLGLYPRTLELRAELVDEYLDELGDDGSLRAAYVRDGRWRERYRKHIKALIGSPGPLWLRASGADLELLPLALPADGKLRLQLRQHGKPLPGHRVMQMSAGASAPLQTDAEGTVVATLPDAGPVLFSAIAIRRAQTPELEWESDFATLTLQALDQASL